SRSEGRDQRTGGSGKAPIDYAIDPKGSTPTDALSMTLDALNSAYEAQPFRPFVLHLADGREVPVNHREFIMTVPSGRTVVVAQPDDPLNIVDLLLVTDLEMKPATDGPRRRRRD